MWTLEKSLGALLLLSAHLSLVLAFNEKDAKEASCWDVTQIVTPDPAWFGSVDTWYHSLCGRLEMYRNAKEVLEGAVTGVVDEVFYHDFCPTVQIKFDGGQVDFMDKITYSLSGFSGRKRKFVGKSVQRGHWSLKSSWADGSNRNIYMVLTDNKSFVFFLDCFNDDNRMSWFVLSTKPSLSAEAEQKIHDKATEFGFKRSLFEKIRYDVCSLGVVGGSRGGGVNVAGITRVGIRSVLEGPVSGSGVENGGGNEDSDVVGNAGGNSAASGGGSANKAESSSSYQGQGNMQVKVQGQAKGKY